jgi:hypothetical protein
MYCRYFWAVNGEYPLSFTVGEWSEDIDVYIKAPRSVRYKTVPVHISTLLKRDCAQHGDLFIALLRLPNQPTGH